MDVYSHRSRSQRPLFTLISLNLLYASAGMLLAIYVIVSSDGLEARGAQARLGMAGLTAACFEDEKRTVKPATMIEDLFSERTECRGGS